MIGIGESTNIPQVRLLVRFSLSPSNSGLLCPSFHLHTLFTFSLKPPNTNQNAFRYHPRRRLGYPCRRLGLLKMLGHPGSSRLRYALL